MKSKKDILKQLGFTVDGSKENTMLFDNIISQAMDEYVKEQKYDILLDFKTWEVDNDIKNLFPKDIVDLYLSE